MNERKTRKMNEICFRIDLHITMAHTPTQGIRFHSRLMNTFILWQYHIINRLIYTIECVIVLSTGADSYMLFLNFVSDIFKHFPLLLCFFSSFLEHDKCFNPAQSNQREFLNQFIASDIEYIVWFERVFDFRFSICCICDWRLTTIQWEANNHKSALVIVIIITALNRLFSFIDVNETLIFSQLFPSSVDIEMKWNMGRPNKTEQQQQQ